MENPEKIILALCILSIIFLGTHLMLVPLLRGRRGGSDANLDKTARSLFSRPRSRDSQAMKELSQRVEQFKGDRGEAEDQGGKKTGL